MNTAIGSLFVGDLSVCCRESHLLELFEVYGLVLKTEVKVGVKPFKFLGYGFVTMSSIQEAELAMRNLNGILVLGRYMRISWAKNANNHNDTPCAEIAFSFISKQLNCMVYEQTVRDLFSVYGCEVVDVAFKQYTIDESKPQHNGIGFVHFPLTPEGVLAGKRAVDHLANVNIKDVMYDCELSKKLQTLLKQERQLNVWYVPERQQQPQIGKVNYNTSGLSKGKVSSVYIDIGYALPYVPLICFQHLDILFVPHPSKVAAQQQQQQQQQFHQQYQQQHYPLQQGYSSSYDNNSQQSSQHYSSNSGFTSYHASPSPSLHAHSQSGPSSGQATPAPLSRGTSKNDYSIDPPVSAVSGQNQSSSFIVGEEDQSQDVVERSESAVDKNSSAEKGEFNTPAVGDNSTPGKVEEKADGSNAVEKDDNKIASAAPERGETTKTTSSSPSTTVSTKLSLAAPVFVPTFSTPAAAPTIAPVNSTSGMTSTNTSGPNTPTTSKIRIAHSETSSASSTEARKYHDAETKNYSIQQIRQMEWERLERQKFLYNENFAENVQAGLPPPTSLIHLPKQEQRYPQQHQHQQPLYPNQHYTPQPAAASQYAAHQQGAHFPPPAPPMSSPQFVVDTNNPLSIPVKLRVKNMNLTPHQKRALHIQGGGQQTAEGQQQQDYYPPGMHDEYSQAGSFQQHQQQPQYGQAHDARYNPNVPIAPALGAPPPGGGQQFNPVLPVQLDSKQAMMQRGGHFRHPPPPPQYDYQGGVASGATPPAMHPSGRILQQADPQYLPQQQQLYRPMGGPPVQIQMPPPQRGEQYPEYVPQASMHQQQQQMQPGPSLAQMQQQRLPLVPLPAVDQEFYPQPQPGQHLSFDEQDNYEQQQLLLQQAQRRALAQQQRQQQQHLHEEQYPDASPSVAAYRKANSLPLQQQGVSQQQQQMQIPPQSQSRESVVNSIPVLKGRNFHSELFNSINENDTPPESPPHEESSSRASFHHQEDSISSSAERLRQQSHHLGNILSGVDYSFDVPGSGGSQKAAAQNTQQSLRHFAQSQSQQQTQQGGSSLLLTDYNQQSSLSNNALPGLEHFLFATSLTSSSAGAAGVGSNPVRNFSPDILSPDEWDSLTRHGTQGINVPDQEEEE